MVETAGKCFNFAEDVLYNIKTYNKGLFNELLKVKAINKNTIAGKIKNRNLKNIIDSRGVVRFFYDAILHDKFNDAFVYVPLFIDEFLIALYIYIIKGRKKAY